MNHKFPPTPKRYKAKKPEPPTESKTDSTSRKRPAGESSATSRPVKKKTKIKPAVNLTPDGGTSGQVGVEGETSSQHKSEDKCREDPAMQVCRYLLEMFSVPLLRSHATVGLVDRDRLQLYHANRSVILVSSAINFSEDDGLTKFIATIIAFSRLSLEQNGVLDTLVKRNAELVKDSWIPEDDEVVQRGNKLEIQKEGSQEGFVIELGKVIFRDPATVGRSTAVLEAKSDEWPGRELVVKISWPSSGRVRETDFLEKASEEAEKSPEKWATNHLPRVFYSRDVTFDEGSAIGLVARLFKDAKFAKGSYVYERRTLRIIVQERLYALKSLSSVRDIGQVFLDTACSACPFCLSIDFCLPHLSSPLAVRLSWDPPSGPQPPQHHVPADRRAERQRGIGAESIRGSGRLRSFIVEEGSRRRLHKDVTTTYGHSALHGIRVATGEECHSPVQA